MKDEYGMKKIKEMLREKLRRGDQSPDEATVFKAVRQYLEYICETLPDETPKGQDFSNALCGWRGEWGSGTGVGEKVIDKLIEKALDERDDLLEFPHLRQKLVREINGETST